MASGNPHIATALAVAACRPCGKGLPNGEYRITAVAAALNLPPRVLTLRIDGAATMRSSISLGAEP